MKQGKIFLPMACEGGQVAVKRLTLIICGGGGLGVIYMQSSGMLEEILLVKLRKWLCH